MLFPKSLNSLVADKFAALGFSDQFIEGCLLLNAHRDWRQIVLSRELQNKAGERILGLGRQSPYSLDRAFEERLSFQKYKPIPGGPQTLPRVSSACARMADKVVVGVIASGSTLTCRIEGRPDARARS